MVRVHSGLPFLRSLTALVPPSVSDLYRVLGLNPRICPLKRAPHRLCRECHDRRPSRPGASNYLAGMEATPIRVRSWLIRPSILDTNFGVKPLTICRMPGANSWSRLIPASPPIVEPKSLNVSEGERAQYVKLRGRALAAEASTPRKYDVFGLPSRVKRMREAA
jgi:hypothetical protein